MAKEKIKIEVDVSGIKDITTAGKAITDLEKSVSDSKKEMEELRKKTEEAEKAVKALGDTKDEFGNLSKEFIQATNALKELKADTKNAEEGFKELGAQLDKVKEKSKELTAAQDEQNQALSDLGDHSAIFTQLKAGFIAAKGGVKAFAKSFKSVRGAIIATGVGAFVILIGSLIAHFTSTEKGARTLSIATTALGIIMDKITETIAKLGTGIVDVFTNPKEYIDDFKAYLWDNVGGIINSLSDMFGSLGNLIAGVFTLDQDRIEESAKNLSDSYKSVGEEIAKTGDKISAGYDNLKESVKETFTSIVDETKKAVASATAYVDAQEGLRRAINSLIIANANLNKELEEQQKIGEDTTRGYEERKIALDKAGEAQIKLSQNLATQELVTFADRSYFRDRS